MKYIMAVISRSFLQIKCVNKCIDTTGDNSLKVWSYPRFYDNYMKYESYSVHKKNITIHIKVRF